VAILLFVDWPLYTGARQLERGAGEERQRLASIVSMAREYVSVKTDMDDVRGTAFNPGTSLAGLDAIVVRTGLKKKLASVKNTTKAVAEGIKTVKVEMSFEKIPLGAVSSLIAAMESDGHPVAIERIAIKATYEDPSFFNATLIVNTVERQ